MMAHRSSAAAKRNARSSLETKGMSTASIRFNSAVECVKRGVNAGEGTASGENVGHDSSQFPVLSSQ